MPAKKIGERFLSIQDRMIHDSMLASTLACESYCPVCKCIRFVPALKHSDYEYWILDAELKATRNCCKGNAEKKRELDAKAPKKRVYPLAHSLPPIADAGWRIIDNGE